MNNCGMQRSGVFYIDEAFYKNRCKSLEVTVNEFQAPTKTFPRTMKNQNCISIIYLSNHRTKKYSFDNIYTFFLPCFKYHRYHRVFYREVKGLHSVLFQLSVSQAIPHSPQMDLWKFLWKVPPPPSSSHCHHHQSSPIAFLSYLSTKCGRAIMTDLIFHMAVMLLKLRPCSFYQYWHHIMDK